MKTCPVCGARAFDDALTCYGCLHTFEDEPASSFQENTCPAQGGAVESTTAQPEFLIRFTPLLENSGAVSWNCSVEVPST